MDERMVQNMMRRVAYGDCLRRTALRYPKREAVVDGARRVSFRELDGMANRFANALKGRGFPKGTKIAFISLNALEHFRRVLRDREGGHGLVPINPLFKTDELAFALNHADCEVVVLNGACSTVVLRTLCPGGKGEAFHCVQSPRAISSCLTPSWKRDRTRSRRRSLRPTTTS
jgi:long-chain acyl-CoA synthetase